MPAVQRQEAVGAHDEDDLAARGQPAAQLAQRVGGVGHPGTLHLEPAVGQTGVVRHGQIGHGQAVLRARRRGIPLERGNAGGHEHHPVEPEGGSHRLGADEMRRMHRIEGAPEDADASAFLLLGHPFVGANVAHGA